MKDKYVLGDGFTLKNLLGITNFEELAKADRDIACVMLLNVDLLQQYRCDANLLKKIHKHIFGELYEWAGEFREVAIYKIENITPGVVLEYAKPENIEKELSERLEEINSYDWKNKGINEIAEEFAADLAKIWRVHPFRDGNTRTILTFANIFAKQHGFEMDMSEILNELARITDEQEKRVVRYSFRDKLLLAALDEKDFPEPKHLEELLKRAIMAGRRKSKDKTTDERN